MKALILLVRIPEQYVSGEVPERLIYGYLNIIHFSLFSFHFSYH